MAIFDKATGIAVRFLKKESTFVERLILSASLRLVKIINTIRNKFTSGKHLDDMGNMIEEGSAFVRTMVVDGAFKMGKKSVEYLGQAIEMLRNGAVKFGGMVFTTMQDAIAFAKNKAQQATTGLITAAQETFAPAVEYFNETVVPAVKETAQNVKENAEVAGHVGTIVKETVVVAAQETVEYVNETVVPAVKETVQKIGENVEVAGYMGFIGVETLKEAAKDSVSWLDPIIQATGEGVCYLLGYSKPPIDFQGAITAISERIRLLDTDIFEALEEEYWMEDYLKVLNETFQNLQKEFKRNAVSSKTIELLFNNLNDQLDDFVLRQVDVRDFSKLSESLQNEIKKAWKSGQTKEFIEALEPLEKAKEQIDPEFLKIIPEKVYSSLLPETIQQIKKALSDANNKQMDFDNINKLSAIALLEKPEATMQEVKAMQHTDNDKIIKQVVDVQKQQTAEIAQHIQAPLKPLEQPIANQQQSELDSVARQRSSSNASMISVYEDAPEKPLENMQQQETLKKSQEEQKKKEEAAHEVNKSEHIAVEVHGL